MIDKRKVEAIVSEWLAGKEYFLTGLEVSPDDRIVVEIDHKDGVWINDCVELSKHLEARLDRDIEDYELEVGSAGLGQPFKVLRQYENHVGELVEARTRGGETLTGTLKEVSGEGFVLAVKKRVRPEGAGRAKTACEDRALTFAETLSARAVIGFKPGGRRRARRGAGGEE